MARVRSGTTLAAILVTALALACASCGGGGPADDDGAGRDFEVRESMTDALANDRAIDQEAVSVIAGATSGAVSLDAAIDRLIDQTRSLLAVIGSVAAPGKPPDKKLAEAQALTEEYLRNRVHQIELTLSAASPAELESLYAQVKGELETEREKIVKLLLSYDPELEEFIR